MGNQMARLEERFHYETPIFQSFIINPDEGDTLIYDFQTHYHPYTGVLIELLNTQSLGQLLDLNTQKLKGDSPLDSEYELNPADNPSIEIQASPQEIQFKPGGAYSVYNWELFFHAPLAIAVHLSKNQRFAEAQKWFHYIFNPTSNREEAAPRKFWNFHEFWQKTDTQLIGDILLALQGEGESDLKAQIIQSIEEWRNKPFQPHAVARNRFLAYQYYVVMKYLDNLIAWGDNLYRQDTREAINEATQIYVLAANILGPKPQETPAPWKPNKPLTYKALRNKLDQFGNALVEMEADFPFNIGIPGAGPADGNSSTSLFGMGKVFYFSIPPNDKLLGYWDIVADRLYKIRHSLSLEGVFRQLAQYQPPLDPGLLAKAAAAGIEVESILQGVNSALSQLRTPFLIQKALEICGEVKGLGNQLLATLEKKDAEELQLLRQNYEIKVLKLVCDTKYLQWKHAEAATDALLKSRTTIYQRLKYYLLLLEGGNSLMNEAINPANFRKKLDELNEANFDEIYRFLMGIGENDDTYLKPYITDEGYLDELFADQSVDTGPLDEVEEGLPMNQSERAELNIFMPAAMNDQIFSGILEIAASALSVIPTFSYGVSYSAGAGASVGYSFSASFGGQNLGSEMEAFARVLRVGSEVYNYRAQRAGKMAGYKRRYQEWVLQHNLAVSEIKQISAQIIASLISEQAAKRDYEHHKIQIAQAEVIESFLKEKFTGTDFYTWMKGEVSKVYYDCYRFAFDTAKRAEQTMKWELMQEGVEGIEWIKYGYWNSAKEGLLSGENLYLDIKRMEMAYYENKKREYELTKHISLRQLNPIALLQLKASGSCEIGIPEWLFDLDCPGHYMRRIKAVGVSIPCVTGPYTPVNCTLTLLKSRIRIAKLPDEPYQHTGSEDSRFRDFEGAIQSVVTSGAQNDSGLFEPEVKDEHYLPFEGAGVISWWRLELPSEFRQFDYDTISDVIIHMKYTAREGGLKEKALASLKELVANAGELGLFRLFSLKHDFPTAWYRFTSSNAGEALTIGIKKDDFLYFAQGYGLQVKEMALLRIQDGELKPPQNLILDLGGIGNELNTGKESSISIAEGTGGLLRDKNYEAFLVIRYTLE